MPHLRPHPDPTHRLPQSSRSLPHRRPIADLAAPSGPALCARPAAAHPWLDRKPHNKFALRPPDAATNRRSVRNTSARIATRSRDCSLLPWLSSLLLEFRAPRCEPGRLNTVLLKPEGGSRKKKPCAGRRSEADTERRARFSYDGLLELFNCRIYLVLSCRQKT